MKINSEFLWEKNLKEVNEDALCICHVNFNKAPLILAAVCDGVGGLPEGENASSLVISNIKRLFYQLPRNASVNLRKLSGLFCRCIFSCHEEITHGATTLNMVIIYKKRCMIISYGDSRTYVGTSRLRQITSDHVDKYGHLTQALGSGNFKKPFISYKYLTKRSTILLCTDGFYRHTHKQIIEKNAFRQCNNEEQWLTKLQSLYYSAVNSGEKDNSTAIAIWYD